MKSLTLLLALSLPLAAADLAPATALIDAHKESEAKPLLVRALAEEPQNADVLFALGRCERRLKEVDAALEHLEKAAELAPDRTDILFEYATFAGELSGPRRSLPLAYTSKDTLEKILEKEPLHFAARDWLIGFYSGAPWIAGGSMKKAYKHAEILKGQNADKGFYWLTRLSLQDKKYDKVFQLCDAALAGNPQAYFPRYQLGLCAAESGQRLNEGKTALETCLQDIKPGQKPGLDQLCLQLGRILEQQGDAKAAKALFEQGLAANPTNNELLAKLGKRS